MRLIEVGIFSFGSSIKEDMLASVDTLRVCFYQLHSLFLFSLSLVVGFVVGRESLLVFCGSSFFFFGGFFLGAWTTSRLSDFSRQLQRRPLFCDIEDCSQGQLRYTACGIRPFRADEIYLLPPGFPAEVGRLPIEVRLLYQATFHCPVRCNYTHKSI